MYRKEKKRIKRLIAAVLFVVLFLGGTVAVSQVNAEDPENEEQEEHSVGFRNEKQKKSAAADREKMQNTDVESETEKSGKEESVVVIKMPENGVVFLANEDVKPGETAKIGIQPDKGYTLLNIAAYRDNGAEVEATGFDDVDALFFFPVPETGRLTVCAEFEEAKDTMVMSISGFSTTATLPRGTTRSIYKQGQGTLTSAMGLKSDELLAYLESTTRNWAPYYLSTPYVGGDRRNPNGDCGGKNGSEDTAGVAAMNCTGFVWHAIWKTLQTYHGTDYQTAYQGIPCWGGIGTGSWRDYLRSRPVEYATYYNYGNINNLLDDLFDEGYIQPGDIIWTWDHAIPMASDGLPTASSGSHHVGIYIGNAVYLGGLQHWQGAGRNTWWHSLGDSDYGQNFECNIVSNVVPKTVCTAITVIKTSPAPEKGKCYLLKESSNSSVSDDNMMYSLKDAKYGVYSDSSCKNEITELVTDADGRSNTVELDAGSYYVKEINAPKGYALDKQIYQVTVVSGQTAVVNTTDVPQSNPIDILLEKVDEETADNIPQGFAVLEGAEFTVKYYDTSPEESAANPIRTWVLRTDDKGYCRLAESYRKAGDEFYYASDGTPALPLGYVTIQETKAPEGYRLNEETVVRQITAEGTSECVNTYLLPEIPEQTLNLELRKIAAEFNDSEDDHMIPGAVFRHTLPDGSIEDVTTNEDGRAKIKGLTYGTHTIREISAPDGYAVNPGEVTFTVAEDNTITLDSIRTGNGDEMAAIETAAIRFEVEEDGTACLSVEDRTAPFDLIIHKENDKSEPLEGAEFTLYSDKECKEVLTDSVSGEKYCGLTDENGILNLCEGKKQGLKVYETYYLKETKAPEGYTIPVHADGSDVVYEIYTVSNPEENVFEYYVDGKKYTSEKGQFAVTGTKAQRQIHLTVVNTSGKYLPKTGTFKGLLLFGAGACCMSAALWRYIKNDKTRRKNNEKI